MRTKAICDLAQRSDPDLFQEVAVGLDLVAQNALALEDAARRLREERHARGHVVVRGPAVEEAAKFLILLDAIRCPRTPSAAFGRQLGRFVNHLAKGIYAESCNWEPATFADFEQWTERERRDFHLDGPNDVDWIFPNRITSGRENAFYVDYVETDEGHQWTEPREHEVVLEFPYAPPRVLSLVRDLYALGFADARALEVVAHTWRPVTMNPTFHRRELRNLNQQTLVALQERGLLRDTPGAAAEVIDRWLFPLYSVDLASIPVDKDFLRELQNEWWYREMGV